MDGGELNDLFGAFDGEDVAETVAPIAAPGLTPAKADAKRKGLTNGVKAAGGEVEDNNGDVEEELGAGPSKRSRNSEGTALDKGQEPTITQHQEIITPDGRRVISFSALPADYTPSEFTPPARPAKEYAFALDPFQQAAIGFIEKGESVLVAAHTSAGKTVTAEYAIAMSLQKKQRVIYTSPIKALSNQKYRDMAEEFGDVGLMTGDITINPSATCLIMTTEILRSMLYRGSEIMREVAWVIYDEIHYMRDKDRGVVWEESIILLPHKVRFVFLSATIPNSQEFAGWIATIHHQPCHVVYTDYRPVPLQHYIFPSGGEGLYLVVDEKSRFREDNFQKAMAVLQGEGGEEESGKKKKNGGKGQQSELGKIVRLIMERSYDPVIIFSFSKRECEAYALKMSKLDFNEEGEKELVEQVFTNAIDSLSEEDKTLPQVVSLLPLLKRGVGIHHGGLLPILKEIIEILFQEGLIKCLFATETFSIGINMPAKTVVFTQCTKFDGKDFRWVTPGEYIQMSGRAGRRGKDDRGIVIMMMDSKMEPDVCKAILYGEPDKLYSSYHVSYNMLLNMLRVQGVNPEFLVRSSFHQYQQEAAAPALEKEAESMEAVARGVKIEGGTEGEAAAAEYYACRSQWEEIKKEMRKYTQDPEIVLSFLKKGRLAYVVEETPEGKRDWGWGAVVGYKVVDGGKVKSKTQEGGGAAIGRAGLVKGDGWAHVVEMCLRVRKGSGKETTPPEPFSVGEGEFDTRVVGVLLPCLETLSAVCIHMPGEIKSSESRSQVGRGLKEVERRLGGENGPGIPFLDPIKDLKIQSDTFKTLLERAKVLEEKMERCRLREREGWRGVYAAYVEKTEAMDKAKLLRREARMHQALVMKDDVKRMKRVLRRLGFVDSENVLQLKGRVACEVNTVDELVVTEMIFNGVFNDLKPEQVVALIGCMCFEEKKKEGEQKVREDMMAAFGKLKSTALAVGKVVQECKLALDPEEYAESFNPDMIEVLYAWTLGAKFSEVIKLTDTFEGTIIRVIRRLDEVLRQLASASHAIGDHTLKEKFEEASKAIRRDIVFAASLYL
uniref:ATP-dependent RNA helicase DOB1 n=1 Tax=Nannochloropsis gaditana (strain CCMP526) TaxID=1093141 RepID=I2CQP2_NANGC